MSLVDCPFLKPFVFIVFMREYVEFDDQHAAWLAVGNSPVGWPSGYARVGCL